MWLYLLPLFAYLLGSVSSAVVIARILGLPDPREVGSRNPGATNILRYGGKTAAILTLAGDILKGVVAVLIARALTADSVIVMLTGFAVFLGHLFPVYFGFRGGKGVATALGVWLAINPWIGLALIATWVLVALLFRYSSLSALMASLAAPLYVAWLSPGMPYLVTMIVMSVILIIRHHDNIRNLIAGTEGRISL
ncbi:MAG: glycerol-3-phosphate 1-O-acyltransferase PlsY [Gammaproteobacteria bacterium]|nr:glycerol-3-phosphate 1-O-acyltransferase PlsY [Gammaproteobacteria bacterium]MDH3407146.1 glycerol-3-phosphate 1-O-acyltransferase PlsY [Gammaproteobacteria bacterium]MDH5487869.1 glycerol-3-phosphate 1-O-acyltransferase PlsY [Gammaproteobacteria bacterium]